MPSDFYSSGDDKPTPSNDIPEESDESREDVGGDTALLPKSFFKGKPIEVGHECKVEIVHDYGDEIEVRYKKEYDSKSDGMDSADAKIDAMASMGAEEDTE